MLEDLKKCVEIIEVREKFYWAGIESIETLKSELKELCEMVQFFAHPPEPDTLEPTALVKFAYNIQHKYGWTPYQETEGEQ